MEEKLEAINAGNKNSQENKKAHPLTPGFRGGQGHGGRRRRSVFAIA